MLLASAGCLYVKSPLDKVEARRIESPALGRPTEVAVGAANRRLTVTWREMPGAASYKIAVRPKNELVPTWREYTATSAPYIADRWAMSGIEYEVRVATVNAHGQSEWSSTVSITVPVLQAAPSDAIDIASSPLVGEFIVVDLHSQRPFENRSVWHWFICSADGLDCKLLPRRRPYQSQPTWEYFMEPAYEGKHLSVQVDYDKEGGSYSATAGLGVVGAAQDRELTTRELATPDDEGVQGRELATHLYALDLNGVYFRSWEGESRGAIAPLGNDLLVASPWGMLALVRPNRAVAYLDGNVPMNGAEFQAHPDKANLRLHQFRVADILLKQHSVGRYELFVTHHYFTGECIRFRLSATTLLQQGADISVSPAWRTIFDADPCVSAASEQAGGRMLTDGPDHLLVVIGTHGQDHYAQDPASHLGKLVRIEIETGRALILASGLRNPQGLTRDAAGTLWETEHGPHGGDELNILELGGNYGWPQVTYGIESGSWVKVSRVEKLGRHDGFTKPVFFLAAVHRHLQPRRQ